MIQQVTGILFHPGGQAVLSRDPQKFTWRHTRHVSAFLSSKSGCNINMPRRYNVVPNQNKAHMCKPNSQLNYSNVHIPSASSFYSLYDILSGSQSGILSLAFDLAFHLTFSLAFVLASWSHILIWHSVCVFLGSKSPAKPTAISRRKKSGEAHSDFRAVKVRRGPQKLSHCKSPARPTAIRNWQVQSSEAADEVRRVSLQSRAGKWCPARRRKKEGRKEDVMTCKNPTTLTWQVGNNTAHSSCRWPAIPWWCLVVWRVRSFYALSLYEKMFKL